MIESEIKGTLSSEPLRKVALVLIISSISLASFLIIESVSTVSVTYTGNSTIGGAPTQTIGTIVDKMNNDGTVFSKGQAIILTSTGQVITYRSESIGNYNPDGSFSDSGIMVFHMPFQMNSGNSTEEYSNSTDTLHTQYDNLFGIYKKTVDPEGN